MSSGRKRITLQSVINSSFGVGVALLAGQLMPKALGYPLARYVAWRISRNKNSSMVRAVRTNQWVIRGERSSSAELDEATRAVFQSTTHVLFDFYHNLRRPKVVCKLIHFTPAFEKMFKERLEGKSGAMFVSPHVGPFDLTGYSLALRGLKVQILSVPEVNSGYAWQNQMRRRQGMDITPISVSAIQAARIRLQNNGTVLTGLDRPVPNSTYAPTFFGRPAPVPVFYIRLALRVNAPIYVVCAYTTPEGIYMLDTSEPIWMKSYKDPHEEVLRNAEAVLKVGEVYIRDHPGQWAMFYSVWPDVISKIPS
jgi:lauroyl/myristoyl acyltransferase